MNNPRYAKLVQGLPATVPFVGPETQERDRGCAFDARLGLGDGEFTLTTGEKTDYESTRLDLRVGKSYCLSEACD